MTTSEAAQRFERACGRRWHLPSSFRAALRAQRHRFVAASLLAIALGNAAPTRADSAPDLIEFGVSEPRERFRRGVELYREGSYDAALAEFQKAYELAPDYRVLYNLAQVQAERHDYVAGLRLLDDYVAKGSSQIPESRMAQVESTRTRLRSRIATLWVNSPIEGAEVLVDGRIAGKLPLTTPILLNAGVHHVTLRKPGLEVAARELTIAGNETVKFEFPIAAEVSRTQAPVPATTVVPAKVDVDLRVRNDPAPMSMADDTQSGEASAVRTPMWLALISTAVFTGGAATFGALVSAKNDSLERELAAFPADRGRVATLNSQLKRDAALFDVFLLGATVSAGVAVYFALSAASSNTETRAYASAARTRESNAAVQRRTAVAPSP